MCLMNLVLFASLALVCHSIDSLLSLLMSLGEKRRKRREGFALGRKGRLEREWKEVFFHRPTRFLWRTWWVRRTWKRNREKIVFLCCSLVSVASLFFFSYGKHGCHCKTSSLGCLCFTASAPSEFSVDFGDKAQRMDERWKVRWCIQLKESGYEPFPPDWTQHSEATQKMHLSFLSNYWNLFHLSPEK